MTSYERTGWRDQEISERHRTWGVGCPAVDFDFVLLEYDYNDPVAVIEYKNEHGEPLSLVNLSSSLAAMSKLCQRAGIPFFVVRYASNFSWFKVAGVNEIALLLFPNRVLYDERGYVQFLHWLRDKPHPPEWG